jgi:hypothetical protein
LAEEVRGRGRNAAHQEVHGQNLTAAAELHCPHQFDEFGLGDVDAMHSSLFQVTMAELGLDPSHGAYLDVIPGPALATCNLVTMFGLHRRLRARSWAT